MRRIGLCFLLVIASLVMETIAHGEDAAPVDPAIAAANAERAVADAKKAAADAQTAQAQAELAAMKAKIGEVPTSSQTGTVDLKDKAGYLEASLLASRAIVNVTSEIVNRIPCLYKDKTVLLTGTSDVPNFGALMTFNAQINILKKAMADADKATTYAKEKYPTAEIEIKAAPFVAIAAAGLVLEAGSKLLNYFKTDFTVGGVQITLEESIVIHALAGPLVDSGKFKEVLISSLLNPASLSNNMTETLNDLESSRIKAKNGEESEAKAVKWYLNKVGEAEKLKTAADEAFNKSKAAERVALKKKVDAAVKILDDTKKGLEAHKLAEAGWRQVVGLYDTFFTKLLTIDDKGVVPLSLIAKEEAINNKINDGLMLITKLQAYGGSYYTKKNLWTALGAMPYFNSGGAVISYVLIQGPDRKVVQSGVVPILGGYLKPTDISAELKAPGNPIVQCTE